MTPEPLEPMQIGHLTITPKPNDRIDAHCSKCGQGIDVGPRFGIIAGETLLAEWIKQHTHKPKPVKRARGGL